MGTAVKDIDPKVLVKHCEMMQSKESYDRVLKTAREVTADHRGTDGEQLKEDVIHAHNISERLLRVLAEEHSMEPFNDRVMAIVLYNLVYGALASTTGVTSLIRVAQFWNSVEGHLPEMIIEKLLGGIFKD